MKYIKSVAVIMTILTVLAGCSTVFYEDGQESITRPQINPYIERELISVYEAKIYFALEGETFIAGETRRISIGTDESLPLTLMRELMKGPSEGTDLEPCFWEGVRLIAVETDGSTVFVTLSAEFLQPPYTKNIDRKRAINNAIYCMVNTLAELDRYTSVQILVDKSGRGRGERPLLSEVYMLENLNTTLGPLVRNNSVIFSPSQAVNILFDYALKNDWGKVRNMLAETSRIQRPSLEEIERAAESSAGYIKRVTKRGDEIVSPDGLTASIYADIEIFDGEKNDTVSKNIRLIKVNGVWKVDYSSVENILFR